MKKIEGYLPIFPGFYGTWFESDSAEETVLDGLVDEDGLEVTWDDVEFDYSDYRKRVGEACVSAVWNFMKHEGFTFDIKFEKVYSPKYYNFENDVIYCTYSISEEEFQKLIQYSKDNLEEFAEFLKDRFTTISGFISFMSNDPEVWYDEYMTEEYERFPAAFTNLLEFYLNNEGYSEMNLLDEVTNETNTIDYELAI